MTQQVMHFNAYPKSPGWKRSGTSRKAALEIKSRSQTLKARVLEVLEHYDFTPDEVAEALGETAFSVRPRCSELLRQGLVVETGGERQNDSGKWAAVLRAKKFVGVKR